jgi:GcrA cell cycle regulator
MSWTDDRVESLKKLWLDGLSASQIAQELGNVTRNAVIGKVHRLGLSGRAKSVSHSAISRPKRSVRNNFNQKPQRHTQRSLTNSPGKTGAVSEQQGAPTVVLVAPVALKLSLVELTERTCKWPVGDPQQEDFHFCGHEAGDASPYCAFHSSIAYQPVADRRRKSENLY